jgi:hypothetical protein
VDLGLVRHPDDGAHPPGLWHSIGWDDGFRELYDLTADPHAVET